MAWEVKKDNNKFQFCYISGGYVVVGTRDKTAPMSTTSTESHIDEFDKQTALQNTIKTVLHLHCIASTSALTSTLTSMLTLLVGNGG
jgi:capsule polysaccharide export protein KpsC/LpsZ